MQRRDFLELLASLPLVAPLEELVGMDPTDLTAEDVQELLDDTIVTSSSSEAYCRHCGSTDLRYSSYPSTAIKGRWTATCIRCGTKEWF